ncbi:hypothetical protein SDC9_180031 [bioreactor metagenome]|uniref:Uncharacterized protein n=1 Tax=bioreactor metagenome TaxID=1076179 RepID=A0A645H2K4_9ZZZZ
MPAQADRPVFAKISGNTSINVKARIVCTVAAIVPLITVVIVDGSGVVIDPGFLQFWRDANRNRDAPEIELTGNRNTVVGHNRRTARRR